MVAAALNEGSITARAIFLAAAVASGTDPPIHSATTPEQLFKHAPHGGGSLKITFLRTILRGNPWLTAKVPLRLKNSYRDK